MARCSACTRFSRFMETDEIAAPQRTALVHPDGGFGVRIPSSVSAEEEPPAFRERERHGDNDTAVSPGFSSPFHPPPAVSISLPASPISGFDMSRAEAAELQRLHAAAITDAAPPPRMMLRPRAPSVPMALAQPVPDRVVFRSQPIPAAAPAAGTAKEDAAHGHAEERASRARGSRDTSYDPFKTWSGRLEKQIASHLLGGRPAPTHHQYQQQQQQEEEEPDQDDEAAAGSHHRRSSSAMPRVQRFFAALEGPELDKLRSSEELILPSDKTWPFLLRFPVSAFGMCMGMSSQAILWKRIAFAECQSLPSVLRFVTLGKGLICRVPLFAECNTRQSRALPSARVLALGKAGDTRQNSLLP